MNLFKNNKLAIDVHEGSIFLTCSGVLYEKHTIMCTVRKIFDLYELGQITRSTRDKAMQKICRLTTITFGTERELNILNIVTTVFVQKMKEGFNKKNEVYFKRAPGPLGYLIVGNGFNSKEVSYSKESLSKKLIMLYNGNLILEKNFFKLLENLPIDLPQHDGKHGERYVKQTTLGDTVGSSRFAKQEQR